MSIKKTRLDLLLVEKSLVESRQKAQAIILSGQVKVNGQVSDKSGLLVAADCLLELTNSGTKFVGRGGDKIEPMFDRFSLVVQDRVAIDVGSSTGGFTDCMLQKGARLVYAVDVGHNQLEGRLRLDSRVVVMEKVNARFLPDYTFDPQPSLAVVDVSFISLRLILAPLVKIMAPVSFLLLLVKPQFELGPEFVAKGGVVKNEEDQLRAVDLVTESAVSLGLQCLGSEKSPLKGLKSGNQEYFVCLSKTVARDLS